MDLANSRIEIEWSYFYARRSNNSILLLIILTLLSLFVLRIEAGDSAIAERGAHHQIWQQAVTDGSTRPRRVVELATGMNYWDGQDWLASQAVFDLTPNSFVANKL